MTTFVTSFGPDMYETTGRPLIESFLELQPTGRMVVCYEGEFSRLSSPRVDWVNLFGDSFLPQWLNDNRDAIPDYLGGEAPECRCPGREVRHARHVKGCHWQWMNRNASRWFRKVAALRAVTLTRSVELGIDRKSPLVWLDSDTRFISELPAVLLTESLNRVAMFYFRGHRPAVESGVMGFDLPNGGEVAVAELCRRYTSREYKLCERWDDGYQIAKMLDDPRRVVVGRDLVHPTRWKGKTNDVIPTTRFNNHLRHFKGSHSRDLDLMK